MLDARTATDPVFDQAEPLKRVPISVLPERGPPQVGGYPDRVRIFIVDTMT
jgi:hypothetical protein